MDSLQQVPTIISERWAGYQHFVDPTIQPFNTLTFPSQNCSIPSFDKIVPDLGKELLGQVFTQNVGIIGNQQKFTTMGGLELEVRVFASQQFLEFNTLVGGPFDIGETITGSITGSTAIVVSRDTNSIVISSVSAPFQVGETITGSTSMATAVVTVEHTTYKDTIEILYTDTNPNGAFFNVPHWYQITQNVNPLDQGIHRYSFEQWFDSNLNPNLSLNLNRLIWVNGLQQVFNWTGGLAPIISMVPNVSITTTAGTTWASQGIIAPLSLAIVGFTNLTGTFVAGETITGGTSGATAKVVGVNIDSLTLENETGSFQINETITGGTSGATAKVNSFIPPETIGTGNIIVNGILYTITSGWETDTLLLSSTTGISVNDIAFSQVGTDPTPIPFDFCRQNKNHMYYGEWTSRSLYISNSFNRPFTTEITKVGAVQNDLVLAGTPYVGLGNHVYKVTITDVQPEVNFQEFFSGAPEGLNDGAFNTSAYNLSTAPAGALNVYKVLMVANFTIVGPTGSGLIPGETVIGLTSGATAKLITIYSFMVNDEIGLVAISGEFIAGETVKGQTSGATLVTSGATWQDWIQLYKNSVAVSITNGPQTGFTVELFNTAIISLTDGLTITFGNWYGHSVGDYFQLTINQGGHDTFQWQLDNGAPTTGIAITTLLQSLSNGINISFVSKTGHTVGDYWEITADQEISKAWDNFYFTLPTRRVGEGYISRLPSNFWTMDTQEEKMYVNCQYGEWIVIDTVLSTDLLLESMVLEPLKQSGALKVIDPWMTGHLEDDLMFVTLDKSLMNIGRKQFLQEPQDGYLSDPVKYDFLPCSFVGGGIKYIGKRLYITSPEQGIMHCFDVAKKYWQPPKTFSEMGIPSIVENDLIMHSNTRNQSFTMFKSVTDNGSPYTVIARTPPTAFVKLVNRKRIPARWDSKFSSMTFTEGYIQGAPEIYFNVYLGVEGCQLVAPHLIQPVLCIPTNQAPLGEGPLGSHALGSDLAVQGTYFNEIYTKFKPIMNYYFIAFEIVCTSKNHSYSILSLGVNMVFAPTANNSLIPDRDVNNL